MLYLTSQSEVLLAIKPIDFRKQIDGLVSLCTNHFKQQPRDGRLYVFINRQKTMIKVLRYERNGYWLAMKRLSRGKFNQWPKGTDGLTALKAHQLRQLLNDVVASYSKLK